MRPCLLALLLLLAGWPARAQDTPAPAQPAAPDTAAALHRLFAAERHKGRTTMAVCGIVVGVSGLAFAVGQDEVTLVAGGLLTVASIPVAAAAAVHTATYAVGRERRMLTAWQQHRLPPRVRRQLRPEYFRPAAGGPG